MKKGTRSARYLYPFGGLTSTVPGLRLNRQLSSTVAILLVLFCGLSAHAQSITISHIDGASSFTSVLNSEGIRNNWTVYGGIAGAVNAGACADRSSTNTCNNCDEYGEPCNRRRIHPNLYLTVYYSTSQIDGRFLITDEEGDIALSDTGTQVIPRGEVNFARVTWSKLCETIGANSDCSTNATGRVRVGVDATTSSTGGSSEGADDQRLNHSSDRYIDISIRVYAPTASGDYPFHEDCDNENIALCNFTVFPGDEKVFVTRIQEGVEGFPETGGGIGFRKVLFFCGEGTSTVDVTAGFAKIDSAKEVCGEMEIITDSDGSYAIDPDFIDDLENEKYYYFRMAV